MRSRVIAIAGAKGSPGCSFLAVTLGRCLAASNIATLLLDGDAEGAGLAALLGLGPVTGEAHGGDAADEPAMQVEPRLWFAEIGHAAADSFNGLDLVGSARVQHQAVVVDLGHSFGPLQRQLSAASDWLLWVVVPDRSGIERADKALAAGVLGAGSAGLVFNRIRSGCLNRADEVLSSRHRMPVMARINDDRRIADGLAAGRPIHRIWGLRRTLRDLAGSLHPDAVSRRP